MTLWNGRFDAPMSDVLFELSESFSFDQALWRHDLTGSRAHVRGLERAGLLDATETATLLAALETIQGEFENGTFVRDDSDEDIHMAIERRATELAGPTGAKLHTARSRNDQVATTTRLFTRDALIAVARETLNLMRTLDEVAERDPAAVLPGYTHLQRAQPVLLSHHLRAHAWALARDVDRLVDTVRRLNVSPLGAGALAGTSLNIDPEATAIELGFDRAFSNSLDAVSDRDFVAEALFDVALLGVHCSRMGEELVLWTSSEFGFMRLADAFTTGSSMLPQKKNSDVAELARGKSGRLIGNLTAVLVTLKGLPLAYNRDLQEDKEPLFDSLRQVGLVLRALRGTYDTATFDAERAAAAAADPLLSAIDLAEWLVERGVPFREAHERVGSLVGASVRSGIALETLVGEDPELREALDRLGPGRSLELRRSHGASGPAAAGAQRAALMAEIARLEIIVS